MRFLLDMGIAHSISIWLKNRGYDAIHLNDENLYRLPDSLILDKAIQEQRIIITTDMDFGHLLALNKLQQTTVIQFRTFIFTPYNIREKLELLFKDFSNLEGNYIITVEDERIRLRKLPI